MLERSSISESFSCSPMDRKISRLKSSLARSYFKYTSIPQSARIVTSTLPPTAPRPPCAVGLKPCALQTIIGARIGDARPYTAAPEACEGRFPRREFALASLRAGDIVVCRFFSTLKTRSSWSFSSCKKCSNRSHPQGKKKSQQCFACFMEHKTRESKHHPPASSMPCSTVFYIHCCNSVICHKKTCFQL